MGPPEPNPFGENGLAARTRSGGPGYESAHGNLCLYMAQLRRKAEPDPGRPRFLLSEPGMGSRYEPMQIKG